MGYDGNSSAPPPPQPPSYSESNMNMRGGGGGANSAYPMGSMPMPPPLNENQVFQEIKGKYEISKEYGDKLEMLHGFKIVFIFDDSGSMNAALQDSPLNQPNQFKATRWDELKYFANISLEIASLFDPAGCDVHFLNKPPVRNVKLANIASLIQVFTAQKPSGYTPLYDTLMQVLHENANLVKEQKLLVVIVTDGEPTDRTGNVNVKQFRRALAERQPIDRIFVTIVACTDDDSSISYLNRWDREIKHLDVVDDFRNERDEVRSVKGRNYRFSYGDYVVKSLVGSIDPSLDGMDERKTDCCIIN